MSTSSEAVADSNANETHLDIETLFRAHYGRVARIIARAVRDRARSEELAVEVFLKLWRNHKARSEKVNYPIVIGNEGLGKQYGLVGMPLTALVDREGRIADLHNGIVEKMTTQQKITDLLQHH